MFELQSSDVSEVLVPNNRMLKLFISVVFVCRSSMCCWFVVICLCFRALLLSMFEMLVVVLTDFKLRFVYVRIVKHVISGR